MSQCDKATMKRRPNRRLHLTPLCGRKIGPFWKPEAIHCCSDLSRRRS